LPVTLSAMILRSLCFIWVNKSDIITFKKSVKVRILENKKGVLLKDTPIKYR
jgi:hypothetical protein